MVSMAMGLVLIATIGYAYIGAKTSFQSQNALALIQENARFAFELISKDVRLSGFTGGSSTGGTNVVATPTWDANLIDLFNQPLSGYIDGGPYPTGVTPLRGDTVTIVHADTENDYAISAQDTAANTFTLATWPSSNPPEPGEIFVAADPTHAAVFQVVGVNAVAKTVSYATGAGSPGNGSAALGTFNSLSSAKLLRLSGITYYIANNTAGEPSLYRQRLSHTSATTTATVVNEELIEGVENMEITYGVDTTATSDKSVDAYWVADDIDAGSSGMNTLPGATIQERWARVFSVRISLTMISNQGATVASTGDGLLRKTFTTTLAIRNRLL